MILKNGKDTPLNKNPGTLPDVGVAMNNWFQIVTFTLIAKEDAGFQVDEIRQDFSFLGVVQILTGKELELKPEGQRDWEWLQVHSQPQLNLEPDDIIEYEGTKYRVMTMKDYADYGYFEYHLCENYLGDETNNG